MGRWLERLAEFQNASKTQADTAVSAITQESPSQSDFSRTDNTDNIADTGSSSLVCPLCGHSDAIKDYHDEDNPARVDYICDPCGMVVAEVRPTAVAPTCQSGGLGEQ